MRMLNGKPGEQAIQQGFSLVEFMVAMVLPACEEDAAII